MRRFCLAFLLAAFCIPGIGAAHAAPPPRPRLVVAIAVDQFSLELFERYRAEFTGGLKRLAQGLVFTGYQSHAATETCPGHSTMLTGDHPARTGIAANNWYDRTTGSNVYCVSVRGTADPGARGSALLRVDTLGDWMRAADPASKSVAVSGKDRAAIMMAGHHPTAVYWWNDGQGFATSRYAGPADGSVLAPARAFNDALFAKWRDAPPRLWPAAIPARCKALQKPIRIGGLSLSGAIPPDSARDVTREESYLDDSRFSDELRASPIFDPLTLSFAGRLIAASRLGQGKAADLLAVSLSSTDYVGHRYGNGGPEACVQVMELDRALGDFFAKLDGLNVPYVAVLTADHGAIDVPERLGPPARRIDTGRMLAALSLHLRETYGLAYDPLEGGDPRQIVLNLAPLDNARRPAITADALAWLKARPEVAAVFTAAQVARAVPPRAKPVEKLTLAERFHESYVPERTGDIMVAYAEGASLGVPAGPGAGVAGHGSPWDYDRRVPILFWWKGVSPVRERRAIETVDIAPTLAAIVGIRPPPVDGHCIDLGQACGR